MSRLGLIPPHTPYIGEIKLLRWEIGYRSRAAVGIEHESPHRKSVKVGGTYGFFSFLIFSSRRLGVIDSADLARMAPGVRRYYTMRSCWCVVLTRCILH